MEKPATLLRDPPHDSPASAGFATTVSGRPLRQRPGGHRHSGQPLRASKTPVAAARSWPLLPRGQEVRKNTRQCFRSHFPGPAFSREELAVPALQSRSNRPFSMVPLQWPKPTRYLQAPEGGAVTRPWTIEASKAACLCLCARFEISSGSVKLFPPHPCHSPLSSEK